MVEKESSSPTALSNEQLRKLAKKKYYQGAQAIHTIKFRSEYERGRYLRSCRDAYLHTQDVIKTTEWAINEVKDDPFLAPVVKEYANGINMAISSAHESIKMFSQLAGYLKTLLGYASNVLDGVREHTRNPFTAARRTQLINEIAELTQVMLKYKGQVATPTARMLSQAVRIHGITFNKLIQRYQTTLGFRGCFKKLGFEKQLQVLDKIIESTGGRKAIKFGEKTIKVLEKYGAKAVVGLTALIVALDTYSADPDKRYETAVKSVVTAGTSLFIGWVQGILYVEVAFALICTGNPALMLVGITVGVATYFAGDAIQNFIDNNVTPIVVTMPQLLKSGLGVLSDDQWSSARSALEHIHEIDPFGPLDIVSNIILYGVFSKPRPRQSSESKSPPRLSTFGLKGPGVRTASYLSLGYV